MPKSSGIAIPVILVLILSGCSFSMVGDVTPPPGSQLPAPQAITSPTAAEPVYPIVPPDPANGKVLFDQKCSQCHGNRGLGDGPQAAQLAVPAAALGLSDVASHFTLAEWYTVVSHGDMQKFMPAFSNLTDRQRWDVVSYAMSLSSSAQMVSQGKVIYESNCTDCHGPSGNGHGVDSSNLASQPAAFTDQSFMAQVSSASLYQAISSGIAPDMPAYTNTLDDNQRWSLVSYLRSLTYTTSSVANAYPAPSSNNAPQTTSVSYPEPATYPTSAVTQTPVITSTSQITSTATFTGSVTVQLINGSGGDTPSNSSVTLYGFDDMQNTYSKTLTAGENGVYTFTNVTMPSGRVFLAGTDYASGTYGSDIVTVDPATPNLSLQITVYDSTTDISVLTTDRVHVFFDFTDPANVQVIEVFIISNPTKQAIVSPTVDGTVVTFPLPQGYTNLQFQDGALGGRYVELSQGFGDKMTVSPGVGEYQVVFAFQMPYNQKLDFVQPMFLPTSAVVVMVPDNGIKVSSAMLQDGGTRDYQGTTYHMYNGSSLIAGSSLDFTLNGTPRHAAASIFTAGNTQDLAIGLGAFGIALVATGLWLYRRNRQKLALQSIPGSVDLSEPYSGRGVSPEDETTLMDAIITLDDQFHAGNLPEAAYLERRAELKEKLRNLK
jgi:mono/diheme cytochrome c family protein